MKHTLTHLYKLFVLSTFWLTANSVNANVPDGVWTIPDPSMSLVFTDFDKSDPGRHVYLYNPTAKMFFASGNEWNTRASVASFGYEIWFEPTSEPDAPNGSYELWDDCQHPDRQLGYKNMFTDDGGSTWVDRADQSNYSWSVTKVGNFYRIQNVAFVSGRPEFAGKYIGWNGNYSDTRLYMLSENEGAVDWKFVTYESYQAFIQSDNYSFYQNSVDCYNIALELRRVLEEAEGLGINISAQKSVYNNTASTVEELQNALDTTNKLIMFHKVPETLAAMKKLVETTNVYTESALYEYYTKYAEKYAAGTLSLEEANTLQNPNVITGWHESITVDNFLLSVWDTNTDFVDAPYYINTWSVEGDYDGSNFHVPFFEYWTSDDSSLEERTLTATMNGMEPGIYEVSALVRVRLKNDIAASANGITLQANNGKAVNVCTGSKFDQFFLGTFSTTGTVDADGVLKIKFIIAGDNNISWLSFKNVKWAKNSNSDSTDKITNPNFDNASSEGWLGSEPGMCGDGRHCLANVAEVWNNTFDIYQDLNDLPDGYYELRAKTSWRGSWNDMENGVGPASKLYAIVNGNEWSVPFNYIWSCMNTEPLGGQTYFGTDAAEIAEEHNGRTYYSPNDPSAFRLYAEKGFYDTTLKFEVVGGQARIGVKNPNMMGDADNWSCFDSFTLSYLGNAQDYDPNNLVKNWDCSSSDVSSFWVHEWRTNDAQTDGPANLVDGCAKVYVRSFDQAKAAGNATLVDESQPVTIENFADWDSQFFITWDEAKATAAGDKLQLKMKVKADKAVTIGTQLHRNPGDYVHWYGVGDINVTTEWTEFVSEEVDVVSGDPGWGKTVEGCWTIAFNLAKGEENTLYFDDMVVYVIKSTDNPVTEVTNIAQLTQKQEMTINLSSEVGSYYEGIKADVDVNAILSALGVSSLNDVDIFAVQSNGSLDSNYQLGGTDGWRDANGDWKDHSVAPDFYVKSDFSRSSKQLYEVGGYPGMTNQPVSYTATYAFVKRDSQTHDAVILKVTLTYGTDSQYRTFDDNTVLLTTVGRIEEEKGRGNWIEGGESQANKAGTINPANGQEGENIVTEGIYLKNGNSEKTFKTRVSGIEAVWAYGCTAGSSDRDLVVTVYDPNGQIVASGRATSSGYNSVVVRVAGLNPQDKYVIDFTGCAAGQDSGADVVLHGVKFLQKNYTEKSFTAGVIKYHTLSDNTVEVVGHTNPTSNSVSIPRTVSFEGTSYTVVSIADWGMSGCGNVKRLILPNTLKTIGYQAFIYSGYTYISIPASVTSIGAQSFNACGELATINVNTSNTVFCSVDGVLYSKDMKTLWKYPEGKTDEYYYIPSPVELLETSSMGSNHLRALVLPETFKYSSWYPIDGSENLATVVCLRSEPFEEQYDVLFSNDILSKATLWVPQGCISNYQSRSPWNKFSAIRELPSKIKVTVKDKSMVYGDVPPTDFEMTATNGPLFGTPVFTCDVKNTTNAGTYDISIKQGTLSSPVPIEYVNGKMTVAKAPLTAYVDNYQRNMGESNPAFVVKFKGFRNNDKESVITTKPVASCTADAKSPAGKYPIVISGGLADNYTFNYESGELTVLENYTMSITVLGNGSVTYNGKKITSYEQFTLPVGTNVTLTLTAGTNCLLSQATMNGEDIMSSISNNRYTLNNIHQNVNIVIGFAERGTINIVAQNYTITYGDELPATYEYTVVGGTVTGQPSITCTAKKNSPVGTYNIIVSKGTLSSTDKLTYTKGTLTIVPATLTASVSNYQRYKGQENPKFEVTYEGFRNGETASVLKQQPVPACAATTSSPAGRYPITLSGGLADNYTFNYVNGELTVIDNNVLNIASQGHGSVKYGNYMIRSNNSFEVTPGSTVVLTFTPDDGYYLSNLTLNGKDVLGNVSNNSYTISNVSQDVSVIAQFSERLGNFDVNGISYTIISSPNKTVSVVQGNYQGHIKIPANVDHDGQTWSVVGLADNAFNNSTSLLTIELPSSLKASEVGISLFTGCTNLAAIIWNVNSAMTPAQLGVVNNQNLLFYANSKSFVPEGIINVVVNGNADKLVLTDGSGNFYCPTPFTAKTATYTHNYTMESAINGVQGWETLALPFNVQKVEHSREGVLVPFPHYNRANISERPYWLYTYGESGFERSANIDANRAYIICMPNNAEYDSEYRLNGQVTFSSQDVTVQSSLWNCGQRKGDKEFCPAFCLQKQSAEVYALNVINDLHNETGNRVPGSAFISNLRAVSPFEAYMTTTTGGSRVIDIEFNDVTGIGFLSDTNILSSRQRIYSLTGQLVFQSDNREEFQQVLRKLPAGVYIINGRKQQIK